MAEDTRNDMWGTMVEDTRYDMRKWNYNEMVDDTCNDMWGMLVRKYGRIPRYDLVEKIDKEERRA